MTVLYRRLLGDAFDRLPPQVRMLHDVGARSVWRGEADVVRGASPMARMVASAFGLPPSGPAQALTVTFEPVDGREVWTRSFGVRKFVSTQWDDNGMLCERVGLSVLRMRPVVTNDGLSLEQISATLLGLPVPGFLAPVIATRETDRDGRYRFEVEASTAAFGLLVGYRGWLVRDAI